MAEVPRAVVSAGAFAPAAIAAGLAFLVGLGAMLLLAEPPGPGAIAQLLLASLLLGLVVGVVAGRA